LHWSVVLCSDQIVGSGTVYILEGNRTLLVCFTMTDMYWVIFTIFLECTSQHLLPRR
jgi:hypothetical protein